jgi:phosphohistidine phosphatase SixA
MLGRIAEASWRKTFCVSKGKRRDRRASSTAASVPLVSGRALVVGHSPTNEAAVLGLAGEIVDPISKGGGVLVVEEDGAVRVEKLR